MRATFTRFACLHFWYFGFRVSDLVFRKATPIFRCRKISASGKISMSVNSCRCHPQKGGVLCNGAF